MNIFDKFKNIGREILLINHNSGSDQLMQERNELSKKVDGYIKNKMLDVVLIYESSGYEMNSSQKKQFKKIMNSLSGFELVSLCERLLEKKILISDNVLIENSLRCVEYFENNYDSRDGYMFKLYQSKMKETEFKKKFLKRWMYDMKTSQGSNKEITCAVQTFRMFGKLLLKDITLNDMSLLLETTQNLYKQIQKRKSTSMGSYYLGQLMSMCNELQALSIKNCSIEIEQTQTKIGILYSENHIDKLLVEENLKTINQHHVKDLPEKAKIIMESLKNDYLFLLKKTSDLNDEEKFAIDNLWNKRTPEIINKYFRADAEFRATMKNDKGQTIEDLMVDSLTNIHVLLKAIKERHTEHLLKEMEGINRYTKALKVG